MKLTDNFSLNEFHSKDGADFPDDVLKNIKILANQLQIIRNKIGKSIFISSGYRSIARNNATKGAAKNSYHTKGMAADLKVKGLEPVQLAKIIEDLMDEGKILKGGLKAYSTFTHYDIRGVKTKF